MSQTGHEALSKALKALQSNPENPEAAIAEFETEAKELRLRADALEQIANGIRGLIGLPVPTLTAHPDIAPPTWSSEDAGPAPSSPTVPEGMEAVRQIMSDGAVWTVRDVFDEMKKRGWESKESKDPVRATEAAVNRLWKVKREIVRVGRGKYRLAARDTVAAFNTAASGSLLNGAPGP